jgi:hypothetical protein
MVCASNMNRSMEAHHVLQKGRLYVSAPAAFGLGGTWRGAGLAGGAGGRHRARAGRRRRRAARRSPLQLQQPHAPSTPTPPRNAHATPTPTPSRTPGALVRRRPARQAAGRVKRHAQRVPVWNPVPRDLRGPEIQGRRAVRAQRAAGDAGAEHWGEGGARALAAGAVRRARWGGGPGVGLLRRRGRAARLPLPSRLARPIEAPLPRPTPPPVTGAPGSTSLMPSCALRRRSWTRWWKVRGRPLSAGPGSLTAPAAPRHAPVPPAAAAPGICSAPSLLACPLLNPHPLQTCTAGSPPPTSRCSSST